MCVCIVTHFFFSLSRSLSLSLSLSTGYPELLFANRKDIRIIEVGKERHEVIVKVSTGVIKMIMIMIIVMMIMIKSRNS